MAVSAARLVDDPPFSDEKFGRFADGTQIPPGILPSGKSVVLSEDQMRYYQDKEEDLRALNEAYENRFRFLWLAAAWIMVMLQSAQMFIVMANMAGGKDVSMTPVVVGSFVFGLSVALFAGVYRFILFPNSRWVPEFVEKLAARVQAMPGQHHEKSGGKSAAA